MQVLGKTENFPFFCTYEELRRVPQIDWFLTIELFHLICKNQKLNFVLFLFINISKCMHDFNAQWHLSSELKIIGPNTRRKIGLQRLCYTILPCEVSTLNTDTNVELCNCLSQASPCCDICHCDYALASGWH